MENAASISKSYHRRLSNAGSRIISIASNVLPVNIRPIEHRFELFFLTRKPMIAAEQVRITVFDTTLRDGEQSPGCSMNHQEKLRLAHQLDRLGVDVIEGGFPIASEGDFAPVKALASVIRPPTIA